METYLVTASGSDLKDVRYVGTDIEAAKVSVADCEKNVYMHVWNGGIRVRTYVKVVKNHRRDIHWKLVKDYLQEMKFQAAELNEKLSKITEVDAHKVGHKDDGEGGFYLA